MLQFLTLTVLAGLAQTGPAQLSPDTGARQLAQSLGQIPPLFIANRGQVDDQASFYVKGKDKTVYFTPEGVTFVLTGAAEAEPSWVAKLVFLGADPGVHPAGLDATETTVSYFQGQPDSWRTAVPTFRSILYADLWPGIDLVYTAEAGALKYRFVVHPGADPSRIQMAWRGVDGIELDAQGGLTISTPACEFRDEAPVSWQEVAGERREVSSNYHLLEPHDGGATVLGFELGPYDAAATLIIDPVYFVYCGFIGGVSMETASAVAYAEYRGRLYVAGQTASDEVSFPESVGPFLTYGGNQDAFVARLNFQGTALEYCGFLGGLDFDAARGIAVDSLGRAYVAGVTDSDQNSFPVLVGPDLTHNGGRDAFVARLNAAGTGLEYCGYIGGAGTEWATGLCIDFNGDAFVCGWTDSTEATFPVQTGPFLVSSGKDEAFVARVNLQGTALDYCGFIGGSENDSATGCAVDYLGALYVTGETESDETTFPVLLGPDLTFTGSASQGDQDAFVARVSPSGSSLDYCGYLGGDGRETAGGVDVDPQRRAYVVGSTSASPSSLPVTVGPDLTYGGADDAFIARVEATGLGFEYFGYIGGAGSDYANAVAVDGYGNAYVVGTTSSPATTFPVSIGPDFTYGGYYDAFIVRVNANGMAFDFGGYVGGAAPDGGMAVAVETIGRYAYMAGYTASDQSSFPVTVGPDLTYNGGTDAFVAKVGVSLMKLELQPDPPIAGQRATLTVRYGSPYSKTWLFAGVRGPGWTWIPALDLHVSIRNPVMVASGQTGSNGAVNWVLHVPAAAAGHGVWLQACQYEEPSPLVWRVIQ